MLRKLQSWWSNHYQRPLKDPLLQEYTLEELLYEYHDKIEREKADKLRTEGDTDKIEEAREKASLNWAEEEERRELEETRSKDKKKKKKTVEVTKEDEDWMKQQLQKDKEQFGDDFGNDLDVKFEE